MGRELFRPKLPELKEQCPSCPFRDGNNAEFGAVVARLRRSFGDDTPVTPFDIGYARIEGRKTAMLTGDFVCHCTAYDKDGKLKPRTEHRQCPGATAMYRSLPGPQDVTGKKKKHA